MIVMARIKRRRLGRSATSIPLANLTPGMPFGNGLGHRGGGAALGEWLLEIDRSYTIEVGPLSWAL